jgi:hypothetical protein
MYMSGPESSKETGQTPWLILLAVGFLMVLVVGLLAGGSLFKPQSTISVSPTPVPTSYSAINVQPATLGYMQLRSGLTTKIYLVSTNASYGFYPVDLVQQFTNVTVVHMGEPCFILNVTIRNDYVFNESIPSENGAGGNNTGAVWLTLLVTLFDKNGTAINATDITNASVPFTSRDEFGMGNGETEAVNLVLATSNRSVDYFTVGIGYMGIFPFP